MTAAIHINWSGEARNPIGSELSPDEYIAVGFGYAVALCDGETVYDENLLPDDEYLSQLKDIEAIARLNPESDWQIHIDAPLWNAKWQRNPEGRWICFESGMGFA
jgi:hypothetical protein